MMNSVFQNNMKNYNEERNQNIERVTIDKKTDIEKIQEESQSSLKFQSRISNYKPMTNDILGNQVILILLYF